MQDIVPQSYDAWRHCIEVECGIALTAPWIEQRLVALQDGRDHHTQRFVQLWGQAHHARVLGWFQQALEELR